MPGKWNWPLSAPLVLRVDAVPIDWELDLKAPRLPAQPISRYEPVERIALVPYGCTKFRVSMFPVTERLWDALKAGEAKPSER